MMAAAEQATMKLRLNQLRASLDKDLVAVYMIAGEDPLQAMLAADAVRDAAGARGFDERLVLHAESGFDWAELRLAAGNLSLFGIRRLLDLRMLTADPGAAGAQALIDYAGDPPPDTVLLVQSGRLDRAALNSAWLKAIDRVGIVVQVWPLSARETVQWISARLAESGVKATGEAVNLLAERAQGNLLAANQEIEKLTLLYGKAARVEEPLDVRTILADVADGARFSLFELADVAVAGDCAKAVRILHSLAADGTTPVLVLWSLTEQVRVLAGMSHQIVHGMSVEQATQSARQQKRRVWLQQALNRETAATWEAWLSRCARGDRIIKGQEPGNAWDELLKLTLGICGRPLFPAAREPV
jgi:DNA polymerase-3 subunit delta